MKKRYYVISGLLALEFGIDACIIHGIDEHNLRTTGQHAENVPKIFQASEDNIEIFKKSFEPLEPSPNL